MLILSGILATIPAERAGAQTLYWTGTGNNPATSGSGTWAPGSADWRTANSAGTTVGWTDGSAAVFEGTAGGTVTIGSNLSIGSLQTTSTAGAFTFSGGAQISFTGTGISNDSSSNQVFVTSSSTVSFKNSASAGGGSVPAKFTIQGTGVVTFADTSTAGAASFNNSGDLHFSVSASTATAAITNTSNGALTLENNASGGAGTITNHGQLTFEDNAHSFGSTTINNVDGTVDVTTVTTSGGLSFGAYTNGAGSAIFLGPTKLATAGLTLTDNNDLNFDIGTGVNGVIDVTSGTFLGNATAGGTRISINDAGGLLAGHSFTLLDWTGATTVSGVSLSDFLLEPLPSLSGNLRISGKQLILDVVPEPGSLCLLIMGAAGLAMGRRQKSRG